MRVYLSHSIRGKKGNDATADDMRANCQIIMSVAHYLRSNLPTLDLYVPAEHEDFVSIAYRDKYLTEQQILEIDCKIIDNCDAMICCVPEGDELQGGRAMEVSYAIANNIDHLVFNESGQASWWLAHKTMRGDY